MNAQHDSTDSRNSYPRAKRLILLFGAILTSLVVGFLAYDSWVDYRRTLESAEQRLTGYRVALAEHARTTFNSAQWVLDQARAYLDHRELADFSEQELRKVMQALIQHFPHIGWINIVNADAVSVANTAAYPVDKTPLDYRDYMRFHRQNASTDALFFGKPEVDVSTKRWRFFIARRLSYPDGSLAGVIGCAFDPIYYDAFYQKLDLGRTGRFLLIRDDGQILVQSPFIEEAMNANLGDRLLFTRQLPRSPSGIYRSPSTGFDASDRIISYQRVEPFPIVATVSMTWAEIVDPWRRRTLAKVAVALVPLLAAAWLGFVLIKSLAQRERAANALAESERKFRAIFDHAPYGIAINSLDGKFLDVNPACVEMNGLSKEEMLSRRASEVAHATEEETAAILEALRRRGVIKNVEATAKRSNGSLDHVLYSSVLVQIQGEPRILSMTVDITDKKRVEAALEESEVTLRGLFNAVPVGLVTLRDRVLRSVNERICEMTGYPRTALEGHSSRLVYETDEEFQRVGQALYDRLWETGLNYVETRFRRADGTFRNVSLHAAPLRPDDPSAGAAVAIQDITEQKRIEAALRASKERLRNIANNIPGVVYQFYARPTGELGLYYLSARAGELFGVTPRLEDAFAQFAAQIAPEDRELFLASIRQAVATTSPWDFEGRFIKPTGETIWFKGVSSPARRTRELVFTGIILDITERKRTEEKLRAYAEYQRALLDNFPFLVWLKDEESRFLAVNALFARTCGFDAPEALIGKTDLEVWPTDLAEAYRADDRRVLASGQPRHVEELIEQAGQSRCWFETYKSPVRVDGRIIGTVGYARDITERKRTEEIIRGSAERAQRQRTAVVKLTTDERIAGDVTLESFQILTETTCETLGIARASVWLLSEDRAELRCSDLFEAGPRRHAAGMTLLARDYPRYFQALEGEGRIYAANARTDPRTSEFTEGYLIPLGITSMLDAAVCTGGRLAGVVCLEHIGEPRAWQADEEAFVGAIAAIAAEMLVSAARQRAEGELRQYREHLEDLVATRTAELRQAMNQLAQTEKLAALGALVAGIAHELNTPIGNAVLAASTLADQERDFTARIPAGLTRSALQHFVATVREGSEILQRNLQRAAELISSFKQVAVDQSSYQRRDFALEEVVHEIALALSPMLHRSPATLEVAIAPDLRLDSFPGPLGQVLMNLITNALVHAFEGRERGIIRIESIPAAPGRVGLRVSDNGNGIAPAHLSRLFDPFFTTRMGQGGSGLGLHIAYNLVTGLLGGTITVRSVPGRGAEFNLELPLIAPPAAAPPGETGAEADSPRMFTATGRQTGVLHDPR
ncbi:MAG: PAS domain S-box protein [Candidatus Contendobacter sp.]|nr:MAG: PAS domain S-box protein [Candidatus Contendobacter sp.]